MPECYCWAGTNSSLLTKGVAKKEDLGIGRPTGEEGIADTPFERCFEVQKIAVPRGGLLAKDYRNIYVALLSAVQWTEREAS